MSTTHLNTSFNKAFGHYFSVSNRVNLLQPIALLATRVYMAWVFFASGLTKIRDWETTLFLFEEEYSVPFINFEVAAWLSTVGELVLPMLLLLGIAGRMGALGLSVVNVVAVLSLEVIAPAAFTLHVVWGLLLAQVVLWGSGGLSVDRWLEYRLRK